MTDESKKTTKSKASAELDIESRDLSRFCENILGHYLRGTAEHSIPADSLASRSLIPPGTAIARSFATISSEFPVFEAAKCIACMECVVICPDAAIRARVTPMDQLEFAVERARVAGYDMQACQSHLAKTDKFWKVYEKRGDVPAHFSIWIDPEKCKGCAECVAVCEPHGALKMVDKTSELMESWREGVRFSNEILPPTPEKYINPRLLTDLFLADETWAYRGGAGSCSGCGEITALKMAITATTARYGKNMAIVAATGCNSVFSSTYPYNIFDVPWTNSLFENAPTTALGVRLRMNQTGKRDTKLWVVGGDGAMNDIGFQALSRMLITGEDIKVLVLDTQVYSNTGGQVSTATFMGQNAKMSSHGKSSAGKSERRKELGLICMMHPDVFVAQVSPAYTTHFLRATLDALEYPGPAVIIAYSPCMPEHGIPDSAGFERAKAAVVGRAFPLFVHDPRKGALLRERLSLRGNPSANEDWHKDSKTGEVQDFAWFAREEGRFAKHFDANGQPSETVLCSQDERLKNWRRLLELAGAIK